MRAKTRAENESAIELTEAGWTPAEIAAHFGLTVGGLYRRGARDPALGAALAAVKRPHQVRCPEVEARLRSMWFRPELFSVAEIADVLGVARQTIHLWADDLDLPLLRQHRPRFVGPRRPASQGRSVPRSSLARQLRISDEAAARLLRSLPLETSHPSAAD